MCKERHRKRLREKISRGAARARFCQHCAKYSYQLLIVRNYVLKEVGFGRAKVVVMQFGDFSTF